MKNALNMRKIAQIEQKLASFKENWIAPQKEQSGLIFTLFQAICSYNVLRYSEIIETLKLFQLTSLL
jgi:hypothetical protein